MSFWHNALYYPNAVLLNVVFCAAEQSLMPESTKLHTPIISFFTGGGFLDIGFELAGFDIIWTNELNIQFAEIYSTGMSALKSRMGTEKCVQIYNHANIAHLSSCEILRESFGNVVPSTWGVIGGPPCPDFSQGGKHAGGTGKNGYLTSVFVQQIVKLNPTFFLLENVSGLYRFGKHRAFLYEQMKQLYQKNYVLDYRILDALDFGVPQNRERFFLIGFKREFVTKILQRRLESKEIGWFSWPTPKYPNAKISFSWPTQDKFGGSPKCSQSIPKELTVWYAFNNPTKSIRMPNGDEHFEPYSKKFQEIMEGDVSGRSFKRLHRYRYSPTAWYGNREVHLHPSEPRRISVREAMRIQTVPEEYVMPKEICLSAKFKLISNGVPCVLAHEIAKAIRCFILQK
ncbi:MAG: DNA cytosine methyltransferase [Thermoguttaceae bacterium]